jgi:hypothetical protein
LVDDRRLFVLALGGATEVIVTLDSAGRGYVQKMV